MLEAFVCVEDMRKYVCYLIFYAGVYLMYKNFINIYEIIIFAIFAQIIVHSL